MWTVIYVFLFLLWAQFVYCLVTRLRRTRSADQEELARALSRLEPDSIPALAQECRDVCRRLFDVDLDLEQWDGTANLLDDLLRDPDKRKALLHGFSKAHLAHYWVLPLGAYLGELLQRHTRGYWKFEKGASPAFEIETGGGPMTAYPFEKVQKHLWEGDSGDLVSFVHLHVRLDRLAAKRKARQEVH